MERPVAAPDTLLKQLGELDRSVQAQLAEEQSFRKANAAFSLSNETTQLLIAACEKLVVEKEAMERANFEEHTADLAYLCRHLGTSLDGGLSDRAHREKLSVAQTVSARRPNRRVRSPFACCCQMDFPPNQGWWLEASRKLTTSYQVLRAGKLVPTCGGDLVPGDILYLRAGQRAVADGRVLVASEGAAIDVADLVGEMSEVRECATQATAVTLTVSCNIVLRDAYLVAGSLLCVVVRALANPLMPGRVRELDDESRQFSVEMSVPPGMSATQCRNLFKNLCVRARLACRSFRMMAQLARVRSIVVLLTQELLESGTAPALVAVARRLGRALLLVDGGCGAQAMQPLAQEIGLELLDLANLEGDQGMLGELCPSTLTTTTPWPSHMSPLSPWSPSDAMGVKRLGELGRARLATLATELVAGSPDVVLLTGVTQAGLETLCSLLSEVGAPPLVAMGSLFYPAFFRCLLPKSNAGNTAVPQDTRQRPPKVSMLPEPEGVTSPTTTATGAAGTDQASGISDENSVNYRSRTSLSSLRLSHASTDPSAALGPFPRSSAIMKRHSLEEVRLCELLVSVNAIGVVSEHADGVLLKSDLGCLAQALELAAKVVPAVATTAPEPDKA